MALLFAEDGAAMEDEDGCEAVDLPLWSPDHFCAVRSVSCSESSWEEVFCRPGVILRVLRAAEQPWLHGQPYLLQPRLVEAALCGGSNGKLIGGW